MPVAKEGLFGGTPGPAVEQTPKMPPVNPFAATKEAGPPMHKKHHKKHEAKGHGRSASPRGGK